MSRYCVIKTLFKDGQALVSALMEMNGWTIKQVEVHSTPQPLFGYHGDQRKEKAHIIIRRKHIGNASNDIGFLQHEDGNYEAIVSEYDSNKYGEAWRGKLKSNYAYQKIHRDMTARGRSVSREMLPDGRQRVTVTGYR